MLKILLHCYESWIYQNYYWNLKRNGSLTDSCDSDIILHFRLMPHLLFTFGIMNEKKCGSLYPSGLKKRHLEKLKHRQQRVLWIGVPHWLVISGGCYVIMSQSSMLQTVAMKILMEENIYYSPSFKNRQTIYQLIVLFLRNTGNIT